MRLLVAWFLVASCIPAKVVARMESLEARVEALESRGGAAPVGVPVRPAAAEPALEVLADELLTDADEAANDLRWNDVQAICARFNADLAGTRAAGRANSRCVEWMVVGKKDIGLSDVSTWYVGDRPAASRVTLLLFAEQWCPHCRREMPKIQALSTQWSGKVQVVGLTKANRGTTEDQVSSFVQEMGVTFPFGKESGALTDHYGVRGVPAAAVLRDGMVVWRGHPARLDEALLAKLTR